MKEDLCEVKVRLIYRTNSSTAKTILRNSVLKKPKTKKQKEHKQKGSKEKYFNEIIEQNFSNLTKEMPIKIQEAHRTPNRQGQKRNTPCPFIAKTQNIQNKERVLKFAKEKPQITYKGKPTRITADFSMETLEAKRSCSKF